MESRRIVVTGVSRGLGLAMTEGFIREGHTVLGCARSRKAIGKLEKRWSAPHSFRVVDVSDLRSVETWAGEVLEGGAPDLVINNAAIITPNAPLWKVPAEEFSRLIDINVKGVFHVIRSFVPAMVERGKGVIVNLSSGWGRSTAPEVAPYCASKWAIEGLSSALAEELPSGLAAVALSPGIIDTEMLRSCFGDSAGAYPPPERWAESAVPFILSIGPSRNGESLTVP